MVPRHSRFALLSVYIQSLTTVTESELFGSNLYWYGPSLILSQSKGPGLFSAML